jgi:serine/threonine-protein kinase RsbW
MSGNCSHSDHPSSDKEKATQWVVFTEEGYWTMLTTLEEIHSPDGRARTWQALTFKVPVTDRVIREVRNRIMEVAESLKFDESDLDSIETAVGEATLNAVRHGSPQGEENLLKVRCERNDEQFAVEITDEGEGFAPCDVPIPVAEDMNVCGYGLFLMRGLMDEVQYMRSPEGGTTVRLVKRFNPSSPGLSLSAAN